MGSVFTESTQKDEFQTGAVLTLMSSHAAHDTYPAFLSPLLPLLIEKLSLTKTQVGFLSSLMQFPSLVQPFIGYMVDRHDLRWIAILGPFLTGAAMSLIGIAPGYGMLVVLLSFAGFSTAAFHAVAPVITGSLSGNQMGRGMSLWMAGGEFGRMIGPILVVGAVTYLTLPGLPLTMVIGGVSSLVLFFRLRHIPYQSVSQNQKLDVGAALRHMAPILLPLTFLQISRSFISIGFPTFLPTFLTEKGTDLWLAGAALSIMEAAGVAGAMLGGTISDHLGRRQIMAASLLLSSFFMFLFVGADNWARMPLLLLLGFTSLSFTPVAMAVVLENYPENPALANGIYMLINYVINGLAVVLMGALADRFGLVWVYYLTAAMLLAGLPFVFMMPEKSRSSTKN